MPTETRQTQHDEWTVNGLTAWKFITTDPTASTTLTRGRFGVFSSIFIGVCLYKRSQAGVETQIQISGSLDVFQIGEWAVDGFSLKSATAAVQLVSMVPTDSIVAKYYAKVGADDTWNLLTTNGYYSRATTEQLGAGSFGGNNETFYAYSRGAYLLDRTWAYLMFGGVAPNVTKISDFKWALPGGILAQIF